MAGVDLSRQRERYEAELAQMIIDLAERIVAGAKSRVLKNLKTPKGNSSLAMSIRMEKDPGGGVRVLTDKSYARYVEFGTISQPALPFLTPAVEEVKVTFSGLIDGLN
ncbi:MAG: hypothetical protein JKY45_07575 [Emcibacter sp.]|nr:hypothetical protein [Emcibacter sp.]